jgi:hypothetical protein
VYLTEELIERQMKIIMEEIDNLLLGMNIAPNETDFISQDLSHRNSITGPSFNQNIFSQHSVEGKTGHSEFDGRNISRERSDILRMNGMQEYDDKDFNLSVPLPGGLYNTSDLDLDSHITPGLKDDHKNKEWISSNIFQNDDDYYRNFPSSSYERFCECCGSYTNRHRCTHTLCKKPCKRQISQTRRIERYVIYILGILNLFFKGS